MHSPSASRLSAIGFALTGFTFFVIGDLFMKLASELGMAKYEVMMIGAFGGMATIFTITALRGKISQLRPRHHYKGLGALILLFPFTYSCFLVALPRLPLANFYTVLFLAPIVVSVSAIKLLHEKLDRKKLLATIAGFVGVLIVVNPIHLFTDKGDWLGYAAVVVGMFGLVGQQLMLRVLGSHETRETTAFYPRLGGISFGIVGILIAGWHDFTTEGLIYSICTGAFGCIGWMSMAEAYRRAPAGTISPFQYSQIVSGALAGYFIWHDSPTLNLMIGAAVIISSGLYIVNHTRRADQRLEKRAEDTVLAPLSD